MALLCDACHSLTGCGWARIPGREPTSAGYCEVCKEFHPHCVVCTSNKAEKAEEAQV